jgi:outer membrane protein assembly factor BamB
LCGQAAIAAPPHRVADARRGPSHVEWRTSFPARGLQPTIAASNDAIFVTTGEGLLIFDPQNGRRIGEFKNGTPDLMSAPVVAKGYAVVADVRFLHAIDARGRERWRYAFDKPKVNLDLATVRKPLVASDGTIFVVGLDDELHAVSPDGKGIGRVPIDAYGPATSVVVLGVAAGTLLIDGQTSPGGPRGLVGIALGEHFGTERWSAAPGIDVSGLLTADALGIVATGYVETSSRLGMTRMVVLDAGGQERARVERGRHEDLRAIGPHGEVILTSRDPEGVETAGSLEIWSSGRFQASTPLAEPVVTVFAVADGSAVGSVGCLGGSTVFRRFDPSLKPLASATLDVACPLSATPDGPSSLLLVALSPTKDHAAEKAELVRVAPKRRSRTGSGPAS